MARLSWILLPVLLALSRTAPAAGVAESVQQTFHVSTVGSDVNGGTEAAPFKTIERARDAVRKVNAKMTGDIVVLIAGGTYRLERTLVFEPADSGTGGHDVIYRAWPGETVILSGGRAVAGWKADAGGRWKASAPVDDFRQLYVGGVRAVRARGGPLPGAEFFGQDGYKTTAVAMAGWANLEDVEFRYPVTWTDTRLKVRGIAREGDRAVITMVQPAFTLARTKEGVQVKFPMAVENAIGLLDAPGEWYLDRRTRTVYYLPRPGEDMAKVEVVAPALERLVELRGTPAEPVHHLRFVGLTFADATWLAPGREGFVDVQANFRFDPDPAKRLERDGHVQVVHNEHLKSPSHIVCRAARAVRFEACTFTRLGSGGIDLECGSQACAIIGCEFYDISATAVQVGDVLKDDHHPDDPRRVVAGNTIANCYIHDVGVEFNGSVGIFVGYTDGTVIAHNEIAALPYSGVSIGWGWGEEDAGGGAPNYVQPFRYDKPTVARSNRCEFNHIHHVMQMLNDGGGIYTLSNQPGTVIRANHVHDSRGGPGGIYLDEGSGFIEVTGNCVHDVPRPMNYNNKAQDRHKTCNEHDNFFDVKPGQDGFPQKVADEAGLEAPWRPLLKKSDARTK